MNPYYHALTSVKRWGGTPEDYQPIHDWLDDTKAHYGDCRHRALKHHSLGIFQCEEHFGKTITTSEGKQVPVRLIAEQHVIEDCGRIPSVSDWLSKIKFEVWMNHPTKVKSKGELNGK